MKKKKKKTISFQGKPRNVLLGIILFVVSLGVLSKLTDYTRHVSKMSYSEFLQKVEQDQIRSVEVMGNEVVGLLKDGKRFETYVADNPKNWDLLREHKVDFNVRPHSGASGNMWFLLLLVSLFMTPLAIWYLIRYMRQSGGSGGSGGPGIFTIGKSRAKMFLPATIKENFNSVAGAVEAKEELVDVIDFL